MSCVISELILCGQCPEYFCAPVFLWSVIPKYFAFDFLWYSTGTSDFILCASRISL